MKNQAQKISFETVSLNTDLAVPNKVDSRGLTNPYSFKYTDRFMQKKTAPNYYPPTVRMQMKNYMNTTSVNMDFCGS